MDNLARRKKYGSLIRGGRARLGISREELGRRIGLSEDQIERIENGKVMPPWDIGERLRQQLNLVISLAYLESEEDRLAV